MQNGDDPWGINLNIKICLLPIIILWIKGYVPLVLVLAPSINTIDP
jgi:hypothetical protein